MEMQLKQTVEEEAEFLQEIQTMIQQQMDDRMKDLGTLKQELVDYRKYLFDEIPRKRKHLMGQDDPVKEANYTATYQRVSQLSRMYYNPYFGLIDYIDHMADDEEACYYIGKSGLSHEGEPIILDWRTPAASLIYQQRLGEMVYHAPAGDRAVDLKRRRQYIIKTDS